MGESHPALTDDDFRVDVCSLSSSEIQALWIPLPAPVGLALKADVAGAEGKTIMKLFEAVCSLRLSGSNDDKITRPANSNAV